MFKRLPTILTLCAVIGFDQAAKWAAQHLLPSEGVLLFPGWFHLELFRNPGIAFGILVPPLLLTLGSLAVGLGFTAWGLQKNSIPTILIGAGGISNAIDRLLLGVTIDYMRIGPWSLINLADVAIFVGLALFLVKPKIRPN